MSRSPAVVKMAPSGRERQPGRWWQRLVVGGLVISAASLGAAPTLMPSTYSWISHTTSESAAQGVEGAWLARLAFVLFGLLVVHLSTTNIARWGRLAAGLHASFGFLMILAAVYSARPWEAEAGFVALEDVLHSVAATAMGFAFAFGVVAVAVQRVRRGHRPDWLDLIALAASILIPLGMGTSTAIAGILQRAMFLIAYLWYGSETLRANRLLGAV